MQKSASTLAPKMNMVRIPHDTALERDLYQVSEAELHMSNAIRNQRIREVFRGYLSSGDGLICGNGFAAINTTEPQLLPDFNGPTVYKSSNYPLVGQKRILNLPLCRFPFIRTKLVLESNFPATNTDWISDEDVKCGKYLYDFLKLKDAAATPEDDFCLAAIDSSFQG